MSEPKISKHLQDLVDASRRKRERQIAEAARERELGVVQYNPPKMVFKNFWPGEKAEYDEYHKQFKKNCADKS